MKKEYIEPQLEVLEAEEQLMQGVSPLTIDPEGTTGNNDSLELDFEEE